MKVLNREDLVFMIVVVFCLVVVLASVIGQFRANGLKSDTERAAILYRMEAERYRAQIELMQRRGEWPSEGAR